MAVVDQELNGTRKLTPDQLENWRRILVGMIGPHAFMMPDEDIQKICDNMNEKFKE